MSPETTVYATYNACPAFTEVEYAQQQQEVASDIVLANRFDGNDLSGSNY